MWSSAKLGPQLSFTVDMDSDVEEKILTQAIRNFEDYNGTGGSFLRFLIVAMMKAMQGLGSQQFSHQHLREAMGVIEEAYTNSCTSLTLVKSVHFPSDPAGVVVNSLASAEPTTPSQEQPDASMDIDDDTDWFFTADDSEEYPPFPANNVYGSMTGYCEEESDSDSSLDTSLRSELPSTHPQVSDYLTYLNWLAAGLQHCLPFDYTPQNSTTDSRIALPMQLAMQVKKHLLDDRLDRPIHMNDIIDPLFAMSTGEGSLKGVLQTHLHVHTVPGLSAHRCCVYPNALLRSCATRDCDRAKASCQHVLHISHCNNTAYSNTTNPTKATSMYIFWRSVVLQANIGMIGTHFVEKDCAMGNSQQARSVNLVNTMTGDMYLQSLQNSETNEHSYVYTICAALHTNKVDLVLCEVGMMTTELVDTLSTFNIAVLPLATIKELDSAADLCGATVLDDIIGMCEQDIGTIPLQLEYLLQLPTKSVPVGTLGVNTENVDTTESMAETGGLEGQECLVVLSRYECTTGATCSTDDGINDGINNSNNHSTQAADPPRAPVSVLLCAPTEAMVLALSDKFFKGLHRWRAVCEDNGAVMVGAGLPELLCVLRLEEVKTTFSGPNSISTDGYAGYAAERTQCLGAVIECFQRCLQQYIHCILMNNGYSYAQGTERIHNITHALLQRLDAYNELHSSSTDILQYVEALNPEEKQALPVPIDLSNIYEDATLQHVLDPVQLKISTVHVARSLLLQLNGIVYV